MQVRQKTVRWKLKNLFMYKSPLDDQLLADLLSQKKAAFAFLYDSYSPALHGSIIEIVANKELASRILEDAFVTAYNTINSYDKNNQGLFTWLLHIARRLSLEALRSIGSWPDATQLEEISWGIRGVLQKMDRGPRHVIELMYYRGYTKQQVSKSLNISVQMVEQLLQTGMNQLKQYINNCSL